ncbi:efflux RND transporter permease subunit, partial [Leptospira sp. 96542]|nr:efflux RND transporter permease subunit [Leptospira sp. 96542]
EIGAGHDANVKVVEVPPGPPVLAPIVAEIYGPEAEGRQAVARKVREILQATPGVVDVDDSTIAAAPRQLLVVDRAKAALAGVAQADIVATLRAGLAGEAVTWLHDGSKYPTPVLLQLPAERHGDLDALLQLPVRGAASNRLLPIRELTRVVDAQREQPIYHKDLLPVNFVVADMAGQLDSPLYGMFAARAAVRRITAPDGGPLQEYFVAPPDEAYGAYAIKWDGEWQ